MKMKRLFTILLAIILALASVLSSVACGKTPSSGIPTVPEENQNLSEETPPTLTGSFVGISKYGNVFISATKEEMAEAGFEYGDIVTVSFAGKKIDIPYCSNYSDVDAGDSGLFGKDDEEMLNLAVNLGNFATTYEIADKVTAEDKTYQWVYREGISESLTFEIQMKQKRGYYEEYLVRQLSYTDERSDYPDLTDEQYGNFRAVNTTGITENILYRSGSPVDPSRTRSAYVDAAAREHGISVIINLADDETTLVSYEGYGDSYYATVQHIALDMGVDYTEDDFKEKLCRGLKFMAENQGVYLIHCKEGKDRTGVVFAILEFLMGATYEEAEADYMVTYYNYYGVVKGDEKYAAITSKIFEKMLSRSFLVDDVKHADLQMCATEYLKNIGLTEGEIAALKANLAASGKDPSTQEDLSFEAFGTIAESSTYAAGETLNDSFYYQDAWFGEDPAVKNDSLALISMQLVGAATEKGEASAAAKAFDLMGFQTVGFVGYETDDPDDCAYTYAIKKIGDCKLIAIAVQSYAFDTPTKIKGWKQNFLVNDDSASGEHAAFAKAVGKVLDGIAGLGGGENAKYWIMGHSRGGALANLIAAKLPEKLGNTNKGIYAYTFESPATTDSSLARTETYAYIHNYLSGDDIVPLIPMWGMVRYGNEYELKSEETELALTEELQKIGSEAAEFEFYSNEYLLKELVEYLESRVGLRENYSKIYRDTYQDENGATKTIEYSYQDTMVHLMESIFSGEFSTLSADLLSENMTTFASSVYLLADAVKAEPDGDPEAITTPYFQAAQGIRNVVNGMIPDGSVSLTDIDFYAVLRLIGPKAIDADYERKGIDLVDVIGYIYPLVDLAQSAATMVYSHQFDVVIARLKALAPQPEAQNFELSIPAPKDGDATALFADAFAAQIEGLDQAWISVENAGWNIGEQTLAGGSLSYFCAKLKVVGHRVPETFQILIDGKAPVEVSSEYENGVCVVRLKWEFAVGTPDLVSVSFVMGNGAVAPAPLSIPKGKMLKYIEKPAFDPYYSESGKTLFLGDWK